MRASDVDREQVVERLRHAATEGRLRTEELEERLAAAFAARTYGELDPLVTDLPAPVAPAPAPARTNRVPAWTLASGLLALVALSLAATMGVHHRVGAAAAGAFAVQRQQRFLDFAHHAHGAIGPIGAPTPFVGLFFVLAVSAALGWALIRPRSDPGPPSPQTDRAPTPPRA